MDSTWSVVAVVVLGLGVWGLASRRRRPSNLEETLGAGSIVFVKTPDRKRLLARVLSRGPSHFWIELEPGSARWWVPATAIEPVPELVARQVRASARPPVEDRERDG